MDAGSSKEQISIAIDGPAASGKSTVALLLSRRFGISLVNSGSMYRAVTLMALERGVSADDEVALQGIASDVAAAFRFEICDGDTPRVFLREREITGDIRSAEVGDMVSCVSESPVVREEMVRLQRRLAAGAGAVVEGRDIGATVLPDADVKVYLEASQSERARRRFAELRDRGVTVAREQVRCEIEKRDRIDSLRDVSPLRMAPDAILIDTENKTISEVVDEIVGIMSDKQITC